MFILLANLLINLPFISHKPKKQKRLQRKIGLIITILDFDVENVI